MSELPKSLLQECQQSKRVFLRTVKLPLLQFERLLQVFAKLYSFPAAPSMDQVDFEIRITYILSECLNSSVIPTPDSFFAIHKSFSNWSSSTNKKERVTALNLVVFLMNLSVHLPILQNFAKNPHFYNLGAFDFWKTRTLASQLQILASDLPGFLQSTNPDTLSCLNEIQLILRSSFTSIVEVVSCLSGIHRPRCAILASSLLVDDLAFEISKRGYKDPRVIAMVEKLAKHKHQGQVIKEVVLILEEITRAAEALYESEREEAKRICTCFHTKYQTLLGEAYLLNGQIEEAAAEARKSYGHQTDCGAMVGASRQINVLAKSLSLSETGQKELEDLMRSKTYVGEKRVHQGSLSVTDSVLVQLYCFQGRFVDAVRVFIESQVVIGPKFASKRTINLILIALYGMLFRKEYEELGQICGPALNLFETTQEDDPLLPFTYSVRMIHVISVLKGRGSDSESIIANLPEFERVLQMTAGEKKTEFHEASANWCARVHRWLVNRKEQPVFDSTDWVSSIRSSWTGPSEFFWYFPILASVIGLEDQKCSGMKDSFAKFLQDSVTSRKQESCNMGVSVWEFGVKCLIRDCERNKVRVNFPDFQFQYS